MIHLVSDLAAPTQEISYRKPRPFAPTGIYERKEALHREVIYIG